MPPRFARTEIDDNEAGPTFERAICDVGNTLAACGNVRTKVESHVVEIRVSRSHGGRKHNRLEDRVVREVNTYKFGTPVTGFDDSAIG